MLDSHATAGNTARPEIPRPCQRGHRHGSLRAAAHWPKRIFHRPKQLKERGGQASFINTQPQITEVFEINKTLPGVGVFASETAFDSYLTVRQKMVGEGNQREADSAGLSSSPGQVDSSFGLLDQHSELLVDTIQTGIFGEQLVGTFPCLKEQWQVV